MSKYEQASYSNSPERKKQKLRIVDPVKFGRAILLSLTLAIGISAGANHLTKEVTGSNIPELLDDAKNTAIELFDDKPHYSEETQRILAEYGDTLYNMVQDNIQNSNEADPRRLVYDVKNLPENKEALEDDMLQAGEVIVMPVSIEKP